MKEEKFITVMQQYEKLVFSICFQFVRDYHEAQNLTQETFLSAYTHIDQYEGDNYKPWLARIATNKAKDFLKSAYHKRVDLKEDWGDEAIISKDPQPEKSYIEKEKMKELEEVIHSLKEPYLKVAELYFLQEKNAEEIALLLARPKKTVQTQILRAKGLLKNKLGKGD